MAAQKEGAEIKRRMLFQLLVGKDVKSALDGYINQLKVEMDAEDIAYAEKMARAEAERLSK